MRALGQAMISRGSIEEMMGGAGECLDPSTFRDVRLCAQTPHGPGCEYIQSDPGQLSLMMGLPECGGAPFSGLGAVPAHLALIAIALAAGVVAATLWIAPKMGAR